MNRRERSAPEVEKLTDIELKHLSVSDKEKCPVCGKEVIFTMHMTRSNYTYKRTIKGKVFYYCSYSDYKRG